MFAAAVVGGCGEGKNGAETLLPRGNDGDERVVRALVRSSAFPAMSSRSSLSRHVDGWAPTATESTALAVLLPTTWGRAIHLARRERPGAWVEVRDIDAASRELHVTDSVLVASDVSVDTDVALFASSGFVEEVRVLRSAKASNRVRYLIQTGPDIDHVRAREGCIEAVSKSGYVELSTAPMFAVDAVGIRQPVTLTIETSDAGRVIEATVSTQGLVFPVLVDPLWSSAASMHYARHGHTATTLKTGKVLVVGGGGDYFCCGGLYGETLVNSAELYDPTTNTWMLAGAPVNFAFTRSAALLSDGRVLVAGGNYGSNVSTAEIYDPSTDAWVAASSMNFGRNRPALVVLPDKRVFAFGGERDGREEIYDPSTDKWSLTGGGDFRLESGVLVGGKVVAAGGAGGLFALVFDPSTASWGGGAKGVACSSCSTFWGHVQTVALPDGRVFASGGGGGIYDPSKDTWSPIDGSPTNASSEETGRTTTLLASGRPLVVGGATLSSSGTAAVSVYDPTGYDKRSSAGSLSTARVWHGSALMLDGRVLVTGGRQDDVASMTLSTVEIFDDPLLVPCAKDTDCPDASYACVSLKCVPKSDTGVADSGLEDSAADSGIFDSGPIIDSAVIDSTSSDSPAIDSSPADSLLSDSPTIDSRIDESSLDSASRDSSVLDVGLDDTAIDDTPATDSGTDSIVVSEISDAGDSVTTADVEDAMNHCTDDRRAVVTASGLAIPCHPYLCSAARACATSCATNDDCQPGYACQTESAACVPVTPSTPGSTGCAMTGESSRSGVLAAIAISGLLVVVRRRRRVARVLAAR